MGRAVLFGERKFNNPRRLTVKQAEVLAFMWDFYKENDRLPTCEAIAIHFNFRSANAAYEHCLAMQRRGYLERNALGKFKFASHVHQCMVTCPVSGTGYKAAPVDPQTQEAELQERFIAAVEHLQGIQSQMQRINRVRVAA